MMNDTGVLPPSHFHQNLIALNDLKAAGFDEWVFLPSMVFGAESKWWGDNGRRDSLHEGIDLCLYRVTGEKVYHLNAGTIIPVTFKGTVQYRINDFLGVSIFVLHDEITNGDQHLFTIYGHTRPAPDMRPGKQVEPEDIIGTIADPAVKNASVQAHLHLSFAWIPDELPPEDYTWNTLADPEKITLLDPLIILNLPYSVIPSL